MYKKKPLRNVFTRGYSAFVKRILVVILDEFWLFYQKNTIVSNDLFNICKLSLKMQVEQLYTTRQR